MEIRTYTQKDLTVIAKKMRKKIIKDKGFPRLGDKWWIEVSEHRSVIYINYVDENGKERRWGTEL
jgi:hypothetical protein